MREVLASHQLFISDQVITELKGVLRLQFGVVQDLIDDFLWLLEQNSIAAEPARIPGIKLKDRDDLAIVGAAINADVEGFVTGDKELLDSGRVENLDIISPRQFWERLKAHQQRGGRRREPRRSS